MELRVHGIGGTTAASMLGDRPDAALVPVWPIGGGAPAWVLRGDDPQIAAYHWAPLTSGSRWFALWPLLLPFTLLNVAGFMFPDGRLGPLLRRLHHLICLATTAWFAATIVFGSQVVSIAKDWGQTVGLALGIAVLAVVVAPTWSRRRWPAGAAPALPTADPGHGSLLDPGFFRRGRSLWWVHVAVLALVVASIWWQQRGDGHPTVLSTSSDWVVATGAIVMALLMVVVLASLVDRYVRPAASREPFAWTWRAAATTTVAAALIGGLSIALLRVIVGSGRLAGAPFVLFDAYGWAVLAVVAVLVLGAVRILARRSPGELVPHAARLLPDPVSWVRARVALLPRAVAMALGAAALTFLAVGCVLWWQRLPATRADWLEAVGVGTGSDAADRRVEATFAIPGTAVVRIAHWTIYGLFSVMFLNLVRSRASNDALRRVGSVWDVLTFWPRSYHPFAVRPYTECAVDQLREVLFTPGPLAGDRDDRTPREVTVLAHSQGTMLVIAALAPGRAPGGTDRRSSDVVHLVTAGCPFRSLYARAFPAYVHDAVLAATAEALAPRDDRPPEWTNVFRFTDHVGRSVFVDEAAWRPEHGPPPGQHADHWWCDTTLPNGVIGVDCALSDPEGRQETIRGHNGYWTDGRVREVVRR